LKKNRVGGESVRREAKKFHLNYPLAKQKTKMKSRGSGGKALKKRMEKRNVPCRKTRLLNHDGRKSGTRLEGEAG